MAQEVAFYMGLYKEQLSAQTRVVRLKTLFPESPLLIVSDGVEDPQFEAFCQEQGVFYRVGDRLKVKGNGGAWTERFLRLFLEQTDDRVQTLFKIDPGDTGIHRPFRYLPPPDVDLFGTVYHTRCPNICGGCMGFRRRAAQKLVESGLLSTTEQGSYRRYGGHWRRDGEPFEDTPILYQDSIVYAVAQQLDLVIADFPEVYANTRRSKPNAELQFALSHPYFYPGDAGYDEKI